MPRHHFGELLAVQNKGVDVNVPYRRNFNGSINRRFCRYEQYAIPQPHELRLDIDIPLDIVQMDVGGIQMPLIQADCDVVMQMYIDAGKEDRDPYWTCPWPSSIALATAFLSQPDIVSGKKVADVGCGLGLAGVAAALSGAKHVVFLDREPLALECALLNAQLYGIQREQCSIGDGIRFPSLPDQFMDTLVRSDNPHLREVQITAQIFDWSVEIAKQEDFDLVLMCDVLYESFSVESIADIAPKLVNTGGTLLLADPPLRAKANRIKFIDLVKQRGFDVQESSDTEVTVRDEGKVDPRQIPITLMQFSRLNVESHPS